MLIIVYLLRHRFIRYFYWILGYLIPDDGSYMLEDSYWWRFTYTSSLNLLNLVICLIGASLFAKTTVIIFAVVVICLLSSILSFFVKSPTQVR